MPAIIGKSIVFGVPESKPLSGFPTGKVRLKLRNDDFAKAYVRTASGIRVFHLEDSGEHWIPALEQGRNERINEPLLVWTPHPLEPLTMLATSRRAPGITLFVIELCPDRHDRGQMVGAFVPDEYEGSTLYSRALVTWLKGRAEMLMADFLTAHEPFRK